MGSMYESTISHIHPLTPRNPGFVSGSSASDDFFHACFYFQGAEVGNKQNRHDMFFLLFVILKTVSFLCIGQYCVLICIISGDIYGI